MHEKPIGTRLDQKLHVTLDMELLVVDLGRRPSYLVI